MATLHFCIQEVLFPVVQYIRAECHKINVANSCPTGNVRIMQHWDAFVQPSLRWKSNENYIFWACVYSLSYPAYSAIHHIFPHYLINDTIFENVVEHKTCVLIFLYNFSLKHLSFLRRTERDIIKNVHWSPCTMPFFLSEFKETFIFWTYFLKINKY